LLLGQARATREDDLTFWALATQAAKRAEALLGQREVAPDLRRKIGNLVGMIADERAHVEAQSRDHRTLQKLVAIHADMAEDLDHVRADREYTTAFRDYGIDVDRLPPADCGARIAAMPVAAEMVDALDQWAFIWRRARPAGTTRARRLAAVARAADPDPWRCRLRDALDLEATDPESAHAAFDELAASAPEDVLHPESISRLACALRKYGDAERASSLLRRAQQAHPDDFWINWDLASSLMDECRPNEAVRFYSAAVAIRPRTELAVQALGDALRASRRPDEAAALPSPRRPLPAPGSNGPSRRTAKDD